MAHRMTPARRAALKKAQLASARKRRGKYNSTVSKTKKRVKRSVKRAGKKYPKTKAALHTAAIVGAIGLNAAYRFKSPVVLRHGHPTPNPTYFPPRKKR